MSDPQDESPLQFPCSFPIKVMGHNVEDFSHQVLAIVGRHVPGLEAQAVNSRASGKGNYLALTITIEAQSRAQLDAIYHELSACPLVLMAL